MTRQALNFGALPTKMPVSYWLGLAIVGAFAYFSDASQMVGGVHLGMLVYGAGCLFAAVWFSRLSMKTEFGIWCILPIFVLLQRAKSSAVGLVPEDHFAPVWAMIPIGGFVIVFYRNMIGRTDS